MASGKSKEAMRRNTDTQEGADEHNQSPEPNEPMRETQRNSRVSGIHPFDSNNQINNDLRNQLSEQSLNQNQISSQDFNRIVIQLSSVFEFSKDDASETFSLIRLLEQALGRNSGLNHAMFSVGLISKMLEALLKHLADHQSHMQTLNQQQLVDKLLLKVHEFLLLKMKANAHDTNEVESVNAYYLSEEKANMVPFSSPDEKSLVLEKFEKSNLS